VHGSVKGLGEGNVMRVMRVERGEGKWEDVAALRELEE